MVFMSCIDAGHDVIGHFQFGRSDGDGQLIKGCRAKDHRSHEGPPHGPRQRHLAHIDAKLGGDPSIGVDGRPQSWRDAPAKIRCDALARTLWRRRISLIFAGQQATSEGREGKKPDILVMCEFGEVGVE